jgi:hypothetical protein
MEVAILIQGWTDFQKGVETRPAGYNEVNIAYNGLLAKSGADQVYLHCGFGDPKYWRNVSTIKMDRSARGWETNIRLQDNTVSFCFKDSANNWDNNNGFNWTLRS